MIRLEFICSSHAIRQDENSIVIIAQMTLSSMSSSTYLGWVPQTELCDPISNVLSVTGWGWPGHLEVADCHDEVVSRREGNHSQTRGNGKIAGMEGGGHPVKCNQRLWAVYFSWKPCLSNNNEGGWWSWWSPRLSTDSHLCIDTSHDGLQSHLDLRSFPK